MLAATSVVADTKSSGRFPEDNPELSRKGGRNGGSIVPTEDRATSLVDRTLGWDNQATINEPP
jgi:hypothetical protein